MERTKIFFDLEFTGLHKNTTQVSIGLISECGKTFYAEFNDYDQTQVNEWLEENVIKNLRFKPPLEGEDEHFSIIRAKDNPAPNNILKSYFFEMRGNKESIKEELRQWLGQFESIEMWGDCLGYDWVLFCDIFGDAFSIPEHVYYIPFDLCTLFKEKGIDPDVSREEFAYDRDIKSKSKHNALWDAIVIRECYLAANEENNKSKSERRSVTILFDYKSNQRNLRGKRIVNVKVGDVLFEEDGELYLKRKLDFSGNENMKLPEQIIDNIEKDQMNRINAHTNNTKK